MTKARKKRCESEVQFFVNYCGNRQHDQAMKDSVRASTVNAWGRSGGFKTTMQFYNRKDQLLQLPSNAKLRLKYLPHFDSPCTFTVQGIGPKGSFIRKRKVNGVRGRIGKSLYLVIALDMHASKKFKFLFLFR